jgi:hypothetical protein
VLTNHLVLVLLTGSLLQKNFVWSLPVAGFKTSRFRKPAPPRSSTFPFSFDAVTTIRLVLHSRVTGWLLCARRAIRPFLCMRMCQLQSAHQQEFESDTPKRIFSIFRNSRGILRTNAVSRVYCKLEIMSRDTNSELTFFDCCENDRIRNDSKIFYPLDGICCVFLLRF